MAAFAELTYNTISYAARRPTYPRQLFEFVFKYHERAKNARWDTAVDLGCGPGQATTGLAQFKRVIGTDPSQTMLATAREHSKSLGLTNCEFINAHAESLPFLEEGSVDLLVAAQAAHWFDWSKAWTEAARVLRSGGTVALWGYSEFQLPHYPAHMALINEFFQSRTADPKTSLGTHWEPGRKILDNHFLDIPDADELVPGAFSAFERIYFTGEYYPSLPPTSTRPIIIRKRMTWGNLLGYLNTTSAYHAYRKAFPEDLQNPEGDMNIRFWNKLKGDATSEDEVTVDWPLAMILAKRA